MREPRSIPNARQTIAQTRHLLAELDFDSSWIDGLDLVREVLDIYDKRCRAQRKTINDQRIYIAAQEYEVLMQRFDKTKKKA
jgi:hypothetical protein